MHAAPAHQLVPRRAVDPRQELPALELEVLARWRDRDVFAKSLRARASAPRWVFYEGPPTANGPPGSHHVLSRVFKDIYPRFKTMCGYRVDRKGGWDCHGLPVEIAVEQELGIRSKAEIESYGIKEFNERCRESVFAYLAEWDRLTERIGFWIDLEHAYRTLDESYIESVWWALEQIHASGLLYEGSKVVPYCPRCETTLSSHEVALGYRDVTDPSVFLSLPVAQGDERLLVWTTTPWTLPGNVAVAVSPTATYARVALGADVFVLADARVADVLGEHAEVLERFGGEQLRERYRAYRGPIFAASDRPAALELPIVADPFVTTEDGTGIVHLAPAFGEEDYRVAAASPQVAFDPAKPETLYNPVRADGTFDDRVRAADGRSWEGRFVKDEQLTSELLDDLRERGLLLKVTAYEHSYPHCWRCGTPLLYYAKRSWYIATSRLREQLLAANETINWYPEHVKHGRFGDWLSNNVDWALSRERYWGTPLPVWRCEQGHTWVAGSFADLQRRSRRALDDHHRPFVDELELRCEDRSDDGAACERPMRRVPEVIDVWFDSGAMPFAQHHFPFENEQQFAEHFPADFICEAQDQTRGWFYSLLAESVLLDRGAPYRNVVCLGLIVDEEGQKMSKSRGNAVEPWSVLDSYGADAFRWYFFTTKAPWDGYRFSEEAIGEGVRLFLKQLWSTYFFYVLYARAAADQLQAAPAPAPATHALDRWALSRTLATAELVTERLEDYDANAAGRAIAALVEDLSNWYVRRSRRRFWEGDASAFATLRTCLLTAARLLAPLCPFVTDEIYDNLDGTLESVHLCDFPTHRGARVDGDASGLVRDRALEEAMALARETVRLGLGARAKAKIKVRQPLGEAVVVAAGREREAIESLADTVRDELNVRSVRFVAAADELGSYEVKANYRTLGPLFGKDMPMAARAIAALDPAHVAALVRAAGVAPDDDRDDSADGFAGGATGADAPGDGEPRLGITVAGREHVLSSEDVILTLRAPAGYSVEREGSHAVALDLTIDDSLRREGYAREGVHAVQNARRSAGLAVEDRIELALQGDGELLAAVREHRDYVAGETLSLALELGSAAPWPAEHGEQVTIDGRPLTIELRRARRDS
jgi:isoleucyl-tRNA synthetase